MIQMYWVLKSPCHEKPLHRCSRVISHSGRSSQISPLAGESINTSDLAANEDSTHRLAQGRGPGAVDATREGREGQGRVETEVQEGVPARAADPDGAVGLRPRLAAVSPARARGGARGAGRPQLQRLRSVLPGLGWRPRVDGDRLGTAHQGDQAGGGWTDLPSTVACGLRFLV